MTSEQQKSLNEHGHVNVNVNLNPIQQHWINQFNAFQTHISQPQQNSAAHSAPRDATSHQDRATTIRVHADREPLVDKTIAASDRAQPQKLYTAPLKPDRALPTAGRTDRSATPSPTNTHTNTHTRPATNSTRTDRVSEPGATFNTISNVTAEMSRAYTQRFLNATRGAQIGITIQNRPHIRIPLSRQNYYNTRTTFGGADRLILDRSNLSR